VSLFLAVLPVTKPSAIENLMSTTTNNNENWTWALSNNAKYCKCLEDILNNDLNNNLFLGLEDFREFDKSTTSTFPISFLNNGQEDKYFCVEFDAGNKKIEDVDLPKGCYPHTWDDFTVPMEGNSTWDNVITTVQTSRSSVAICNMTQKLNLYKYKVTSPKVANSNSMDLVTIGPHFTKLHEDTYHPVRTSLIPAWNIGARKLWFIAKRSTVRERASYRFQTDSNNLNTIEKSFDWVYENKNLFIWVLQKPGAVMKHRGGHPHGVITLIDTSVNPQGLCLSVGFSTTKSKDVLTYARNAPPRAFKNNEWLPTTRKKFKSEVIHSSGNVTKTKELKNYIKKEKKVEKKKKTVNKGQFSKARALERKG
jgi:hypothetical protein